MISSELPEILGMSDRIMVIGGGRVRGFLNRDEATEETIMELATVHRPARRRTKAGASEPDRIRRPRRQTGTWEASWGI